MGLRSGAIAKSYCTMQLIIVCERGEKIKCKSEIVKVES